MFRLLFKGQTHTVLNLTEKRKKHNTKQPILLTGPLQVPPDQRGTGKGAQNSSHCCGHAVSCQQGRSKVRFFFSSLPMHLVYWQGQAVLLLVCLEIFT